LAATNKIRSCAAVAIDDDTLLLVMHADTYNAVLRQHHYRQKQLSSATALLSELPLFKHHIYSKIASVAYTMRSQTYSSQSVIVKAGDVINNVLLIASGSIKVYAPSGEEFFFGNNSSNDENRLDKTVVKRLPRLAVAMLGRGQIIGEVEVHKNLRTFQMTYEASAASTEVLEIPLPVFKEALDAGDFRRSQMYKSIECVVDDKEQKRAGRVSRAYEAMVKMLEGPAKALKSKEEIMNMLPLLVEQGNTLSTLNAKKQYGRTTPIHSAPSSPRYNNINPVATLSPRPNAATTVATPVAPMTPLSPRKEASIRSPRKLSYSSPVH
jgi:hypothetical protein